jgi:hypothetical protein
MNQLKNAKSEVEWNAICDGVKNSRGGKYPDDWYGKVILSGLAGKVSRNW